MLPRQRTFKVASIVKTHENKHQVKYDASSRDPTSPTQNATEVVPQG